MYYTFYSLRCNINCCVKSDNPSSGIRTKIKCTNKIIAQRRNANFIRLHSEFLREIDKEANKKEMTTRYSCFLLQEGNAQKLILELLLDIIYLAYLKYVAQYRAYNALGILNNTNNIINDIKNRCYITFVDRNLLFPVVVPSARRS